MLGDDKGDPSSCGPEIATKLFIEWTVSPAVPLDPTTHGILQDVKPTITCFEQAPSLSLSKMGSSVL